MERVPMALFSFFLGSFSSLIAVYHPHPPLRGDLPHQGGGRDIGGAACDSSPLYGGRVGGGCPKKLDQPHAPGNTPGRETFFRFHYDRDEWARELRGPTP